MKLSVRFVVLEPPVLGSAPQFGFVFSCGLDSERFSCLLTAPSVDSWRLRPVGSRGLRL